MISLLARLRGAACAALLLAIGSSSSALLAQDQLAREVSFVRALAKEMRFIELAKLEAERLATEYRGAGDQDRIAQLSVEVSYYGARARSDRNQQRTLFKETVEKSQELIDRSTDPEVKTQAMATLANASQDFAQFLIEELEIARNEAPERVKEIQEEVIAVLKAGKEACASVRATLESERDDPQKNVEYGLMWMKQGVLTREQAKADKENRGVLVSRAIEELEEMVLTYGEESALGLRGLFEIAQCYEVGGDVDEAITWYTDTIDQICASLDGYETGELNLSGEMVAFLFDMMQEVYVRAGETMAREGKEGTAELFEAFRANMKKYGAKDRDLFDVVSPTYGHLMLLAEARFKAESGDPAKVQEALAMTQRINDKHPNDYIGVRAKATLKEILAVQSSAVSGKLLFEVGKGALQKKDYEQAIKSLRKAIAAMSADEAKEVGLDAWSMLGDAYRRNDRQLEAMFAYQEGLKAHGVNDGQTGGDPAKERLANLSSDTADNLDRVVTAHKRTTKDDPFFASFHAELISLAAKYSSGGADKLAYKEGNKAFQSRDYAKAASEFAKVTPEYTYYELARVRLARAQASAGDFAASRATLAEYRKYIEEHELGARETGRMQVRKAALAAAAYNEVQMAYYEARGNKKFNLERNLEKYPAAIEQIQSFLTNHRKDGEIYVPQVLAYLGRLHVDTGALDQAERAYAELKTVEPARAARLATEIFQEYQNQVKLLVEERDKAIAEDKPQKVIAQAEAKVIEQRKKLVALGGDYIQSSPRPQLAILVNTMLNWQEIGDWQKVDEVAKKTLALYGDVTEESSKRVIDQLVRPMIGEALLQQRRFQEAYDMLVEAEKANPTQWEIKRQIARALGGWFEFDPRTAQQVREPGLDRPEEAYMKYYGHPTDSYRIWMSRPEVKKFSLEWYRFMWEAYWFAKQAGKKDSKYAETAKKFFRIARSTNDFATLKSYGKEGLMLFRYFQANR
ncbi:MAG TPA: hypothetical protein ENI87_10510 [bacterium]|nr:hypothetical protein [bacterium]